MIRNSDIQWWILEAQQHPEAVPKIIEELAGRLQELDAENERLRAEAIQLERRGKPTEENSELDELRQKIATLQSLLDSSASAEPSLLFMSSRTQAARLPLSQALRQIHQEKPILARTEAPHLNRVLLAHPQDEIVLLTTQGYGIKINLLQTPALREDGGWPQAADAEARLAAAAAFAKPPRFWTIVTRRGFVRQHIRIGFERDLSQGKRLVDSPFHNDHAIALVSGDQGDLLLTTRWGKAIRFPQRSIAAEGEMAIDLEPDDEIAAALPLPSNTEVLLVTASGFVLRRDTSQIESRSRPGGAGKQLIQAYDLLECFSSAPDAQLLFLTYAGKAHTVPITDVPLFQRSSKGIRARDLDRDPAVAVALLPNTL